MNRPLSLAKRPQPVQWQWRRTGYSSPQECSFAGRQTLYRLIKASYITATQAATPPAGQPFVDPDADTGLPFADAEFFYDVLLHEFTTALQKHARTYGHQFFGVAGGDQ